jgi:lactoylglutathione lyase
MVRVKDLTASLHFYCAQLGLQETQRIENEAGRYTLVYLNAPEDAEQAKSNHSPLLELTYS